MTNLKVDLYLPSFGYSRGDGIDHADRLRQWCIRAEALGDGHDEEHLERSYMFGAFDQVVAQCQARVDVGIEHLILHPYTDDPAQLETWGRELLPRLKSMTVSRPRA